MVGMGAAPTPTRLPSGCARQYRCRSVRACPGAPVCPAGLPAFLHQRGWAPRPRRCCVTRPPLFGGVVTRKTGAVRTPARLVPQASPVTTRCLRSGRLAARRTASANSLPVVPVSQPAGSQQFYVPHRAGHNLMANQAHCLCCALW